MATGLEKQWPRTRSQLTAHPYFLVTASNHPERNQRLDLSLLAWLEDLRGAVRAEFEAASWPNAGEVDVLFDSEHRVREGSGFWYFK
jgi:hypothetical protein